MAQGETNNFSKTGGFDGLMVHDWDPKNEQSEVFFRNFFLQFDVMRLSSAVREIQYAMHVACMPFVFTYS